MAPTAPMTAAQRVDEARRRMGAGDWTGTRIVLDEARALSPDEPLLSDIAYLEAFSLEMEGSLAEALIRWDRLQAQHPSDDVAFRRAETLAQLSRYAEAEAALESLGDPAARSASDRAKLELLRAMWQVQLGEVKPGLKALHAALGRSPESTPAEFAARGHVVLTESATSAASGIEFTGSDRKKKKALEQRATLVKGVREELVVLIQLGHNPSTLRGFEAAVQAYDDLGAALLAETPPKKLTEAQLRVNRELLGGRVQNVWITASQLAGMAADWALQVGYASGDVAKLAARKQELEARIAALPLPTVRP